MATYPPSIVFKRQTSAWREVKTEPPSGRVRSPLIIRSRHFMILACMSVLASGACKHKSLPSTRDTNQAHSVDSMRTLNILKRGNDYPLSDLRSGEDRIFTGRIYDVDYRLTLSMIQ
jgi:hypothetical protein